MMDMLLSDLDRDPYPVLARMRASERLSWVEELGMWFVTNYDDAQAILRDNQNFIVGTDQSLIYDTFGAHMLTTEGELQERHRRQFRGAFAPARIRAAMTADVRGIVDRLISGFQANGEVELRSAFASRLPILSILHLFGFPASAEPQLRLWYDSFEAALANFEWSESVRDTARTNVVAFHALIQEQIDKVRTCPGEDLLSAVVLDGGENQLDDEEIKRNASIIFFGGISTVEALIMNAVYGLCTHPQMLDRVREDRSLIAGVIDETMRWLAPVQSATRHVAHPIHFAGVDLAPGDIVNCMIGAANRDPAVFPDPDQFSLDRPNSKRHLGFAVGPHFCLGSHLARLEAETALEALLSNCPRLRLRDEAAVEVRGYEFRQPKALQLVWEATG